MIPHADTRRGGAEAYLMGLVADVLSKGHRVTILCQSATNVPSGVEIKKFSVKGSAVSRILQFWNGLDSYLKENSFDIVHSLDLCPHMNIHNPHGGDEGVWLQQYLNSKVGLDKWLSRLKRKWGKRQKVVFDLEKKQFSDPKLKKVIAISPFVKNSIQQHHPLDDEKFALIPNGTDTSRFSCFSQQKREELRQQYGISHDQRLIIFVAHNFALKGLSSFVQTIAELKRQGNTKLQAWVIGQGRKGRYRSLVRRLGLSEILQFKGRMTKMDEVYNMADLTLAPSYYDACSLSTLESLLCGTPVVTTEVNGANLYLEEGITGGVVKGPENVQELASKSAYFLEEGKARKARLRASESVSQYTRIANSEAVLAVYEDILN